MKFFLLIFILSASVHAQNKDAFRNLLGEILKKDPEFKETDLTTPLFDSQVKQSFSKLLMPKVDLTLGHYEQRNNLNVNNAGNQYQLGGIRASFNLFSFGSDLNLYRSSLAEKKGQLQRVSSRLMTREQEVGALVLNYLKEARNVKILSKILGVKEEALKVSRRRYDLGNLSEQDHSKVKLDVSNAKAELLVAQQTLNSLTARIRSYEVEALPEDYPLEQELTYAKVEELKKMNTPVSDLPQYLEANLAEEASEYRSRARKAVMFGNVDLSFARNYYEFLDQSQWEWRASIAYTLPLFDQFDQYTEYRRNDVLQKTNAIRKRFQENLSANHQAAEVANLDVSWKNWVERKESLGISSKLYSSSLAQFNQGQLSVNELLVDQDRLLRTEQIANFALHQLHTSVLTFCHSQGKAFIQGCF